MSRGARGSAKKLVFPGYCSNLGKTCTGTDGMRPKVFASVKEARRKKRGVGFLFFLGGVVLRGKTPSNSDFQPVFEIAGQGWARDVETAVLE